MMSVSLDEFLLNVRWADVLDVAAMSVVLYFGFKWLLRRSSRSAGAVLAGVALLYVVSRALKMYLTLTVFHAGFIFLLFSLVVVFQQDLRHAFERLASWRPFRTGVRTSTIEPFLAALTEATRELAERRVGALIVLPGRQPLERHLRGGILADAHLSVPLLVSIFDPGSPGHDGAVILHRERIHKLAVHLPLSSNLDQVGDCGTRHAAALGLAERSDALIVVVSEERGTVSIAEEGILEPLATAAELSPRLARFFHSNPWQPDHPLSAGSLWKRLVLGAGAVTIACLLWFSVAFRLEQIQRVLTEVPIELRNVPANWIIEELTPNSLDVTVYGPERAFENFRSEDVKISIEMRDPQDGRQFIAVTPRHVLLPDDDLHVRDLSTNGIRLEAYHVETVRLPVEVPVVGKLPRGYELGQMRVLPAHALVRLASHRKPYVKSVPTSPVRLNSMTESTTLTLPLQIPDRAQLDPGSLPTVSVTIEIRRVQEGAGQSVR